MSKLVLMTLIRSGKVSIENWNQLNNTEITKTNPKFSEVFDKK